jgi:hypothetical protein
MAKNQAADRADFFLSQLQQSIMLAFAHIPVRHEKWANP